MFLRLRLHRIAECHLYDRVARAQAREEKLKKEAMLDDLLKAVFGYGCRLGYSFYPY